MSGSIVIVVEGGLMGGFDGMKGGEGDWNWN